MQPLIAEIDYVFTETVTDLTEWPRKAGKATDIPVDQH